LSLEVEFCIVKFLVVVVPRFDICSSLLFLYFLLAYWTVNRWKGSPLAPEDGSVWVPLLGGALLLLLHPFLLQLMV
jgi:hypothetical protein